MIPGVNIRGKVRVAGLNKAGGALVGAPGGVGGWMDALRLLSRILGRRAT